MELPVTGIHVVDWAFGLLAAHAYLIAFIFAVTENVFVVGTFSFGETMLLAAGFVASLAGPRDVDLLPLFGIVVAGELLGSNISYLIGLRGGRPLLERFGPGIAARVGDAEAYFERRGSLTVLLGRFAPGIKNFLFTIAGVSRMRLAVFEVYALAGAAAYSALVLALGYFFGSNFHLLLTAVHGIGYGALLIAAALAAVVAFNRWQTGRRQQRNATAGSDGRSGDGGE
jgi:membrane protein DedA with SNARE-associated domain